MIRSLFCDHHTVEKRSDSYQCSNCGRRVSLNKADELIIHFDNGEIRANVNTSPDLLEGQKVF